MMIRKSCVGGAMALCLMTQFGADQAASKGKKSVYDFVMKSIDGVDVKLSNYKGNVLLIVNVASK